MTLGDCQTEAVAPHRVAVVFAMTATLLFAAPAWSEVRAHLDRNKVFVGDPVTLVIESSGASSGEPDLSPLNKDFRVLGTGTSTQFSIVNGRSSNRTTWTVQLGPLQVGKLQIPPIRVGSEQTGALELEVTDTPEQVSAQQSEHLFLEAELGSGGRVYVQQQLPYTLRFYHDETLLNGDLRSPQIQDAVIRQLGDERRYTVTRNNRRYQVVERRYSILPEKSGRLRIPPASFTGQISAGKSTSVPPSRRDRLMQQFFRNSPFTTGGKSVRVFSKPIELDVLPTPAGFGSAWIPAEDLQLHDSWTNDPPEFRAGVPVSRTLSLRATGLAGTQIPTLELEQPRLTRIYPESPVNETRTDRDKLYGLSRQTFTYIPGEAGELTIPAVEVPWWNTRSDEQAVARLPEWVIRVQPGLAAAGPAPDATQRQQVQGVAPRKGPVDAPIRMPAAGGPTTFVMTHWPWLLLAVLVLPAIVWGVRRWHTRGTAAGQNAAPVKTAAPAPHRPEVGDLLPRLQQACERNDAKLAAQTLLELATTRWPDDPPRSLGHLANRLEIGQEQVLALDRALYAADRTDWDGAALWTATQASWGKPGASRKPHTPVLAPLYPHSG